MSFALSFHFTTHLNACPIFGVSNDVIIEFGLLIIFVPYHDLRDTKNVTAKGRFRTLEVKVQSEIVHNYYKRSIQECFVNLSHRIVKEVLINLIKLKLILLKLVKLFEGKINGRP